MNVAAWRVYIKPFLDNGDYGDFIEVTEDVDQNSLGSFSQQLDNGDYDFGIYTNNSINLSLRNGDGKYSDVTISNSIFRIKRSNSIVKFTYQVEQDGPWCGDAILGDAYTSEELTIFTGLLSDETLSMDLDTLEPQFQVLGRESIFDTIIVPVDDLTDGELLSSIVFKILNQDAVTQVLNVDALNINLGLDEASDIVSVFTGKTGKDSLDEILKITNSVLYIDGDDIIVSPREPTADIKEAFFGQASNLGPENIEMIRNIKTGINRTFNYFTWDGSPVIVKDNDSISIYGNRSSKISSDIITDNTKQINLLEDLLAEFSLPRQEFDLIVPTTYQTMGLKLLSRCTIDYPIVYLAQGNPLPICGVAICGQGILPKGLWAFTISPSDNLKLLGRSIDVKSGLTTFKMRGIANGA